MLVLPWGTQDSLLLQLLLLFICYCHYVCFSFVVAPSLPLPPLPLYVLYSLDCTHCGCPRTFVAPVIVGVSSPNFIRTAVVPCLYAATGSGRDSSSTRLKLLPLSSTCRACRFKKKNTAIAIMAIAPKNPKMTPAARGRSPINETSGYSRKG